MVIRRLSLPAKSSTEWVPFSFAALQVGNRALSAKKGWKQSSQEGAEDRRAHLSTDVAELAKKGHELIAASASSSEGGALVPLVGRAAMDRLSNGMKLVQESERKLKLGILGFGDTIFRAKRLNFSSQTGRGDTIVRCFQAAAFLLWGPGDRTQVSQEPIFKEFHWLTAGVAFDCLARGALEFGWLNVLGLMPADASLFVFQFHPCLRLFSATDHSLSPRSTQYTVFFGHLNGFQKAKQSGTLMTDQQALKNTLHFEALYNARHVFAATLSPHLLPAFLSGRSKPTRNRVHLDDFFPPLSVKPDNFKVEVEKLIKDASIPADNLYGCFKTWKKEFEPFFNMSGPSVVTDYMTGLRLALEQATPRLRCINQDEVLPSKDRTDIFVLAIPRFKPRSQDEWSKTSPEEKMAEFIALGKVLAPFDAPAFAPDLSEGDLRSVPFLAYDRERL